MLPLRPSKKRKLRHTGPTEILFDPAAREDYLTGFHKRKLARVKAAQEIAKRKEREERLRERKALREQRKNDLIAHVQAVNEAMRRVNGVEPEQESESDIDGEAGVDGEWGGFSASESDLDREDEYIDEGKYTTVSVEAVNITREGFTRPGEEESGDEDGEGREDGVGGHGEGVGRAREAGGENAVWKDGRGKNGPKKRKRKFKYEGKEERKNNLLKERAKGRIRAKARRSGKGAK